MNYQGPDKTLTMLTPEQTSRMLCISPRTLENWRYRGMGPKYLQISKRCIRYRLSDIEEWQQSILRKSTSDNAAR
ncbi:MAG: DNA-binding protein [Verrucomicrobiae bacterium]|nr:DNA-binding protein [Verrucomicrobiae bacterium]